MRPLIEQTNLEKHLDYIKETETDYSIKQEEVRFIQSGIETLVQKLYDIITEESGNRIDCKNNNILKVGSFYEGTKNKFPNEFDFIFVFQKNTPNCVDVSDKIKEKHTVLRKDLKYSENASRTICFSKFVKRQGPASKLMFIYQQDKCKDTCLYVDIVPAVKEIDAELGDSVETICKLKSFREEIVKTGSYLLVGINTPRWHSYPVTSFTETEVHFMKHTLSSKHVTVYKLLKFLIGGHGHAEIMREKIPGEGFSSYMIKIAMIEHHYECENTDSEDKGTCVLTLLEKILCYKREKNYPLLTSDTYKNIHGKSEEILEKLIESLRSMQNSTNRLKLNGKLKLKPVGKQRLVKYKRIPLVQYIVQPIIMISALVMYVCIMCLYVYINLYNWNKKNHSKVDP
ncbi:uncharacterized protein LOC128550256 [Mercenaria mercenaria]|uniref:uncharacterized protein LOC128550256 n=1 Tax=Mercenaria mercenaria TaxID=6596 RepID=UPI00234F2F53|nr:uncharacterized protein LOC128550256 [Mercenaria mercenaria]